jgi:hypothetical protein
VARTSRGTRNWRGNRVVKPAGVVRPAATGQRDQQRSRRQPPASGAAGPGSTYSSSSSSLPLQNSSSWPTNAAKVRCLHAAMQACPALLLLISSRPGHSASDLALASESETGAVPDYQSDRPASAWAWSSPRRPTDRLPGPRTPETKRRGPSCLLPGRLGRWLAGRHEVGPR